MNAMPARAALKTTKSGKSLLGLTALRCRAATALRFFPSLLPPFFRSLHVKQPPETVAVVRKLRTFHSVSNTRTRLNPQLINTGAVFFLQSHTADAAAAPETASRRRHPAGAFCGHQKSPRLAGKIADCFCLRPLPKACPQKPERSLRRRNPSSSRDRAGSACPHR